MENISFQKYKEGELVLTQSPSGWIEAEVTKLHDDGTVDLHVKRADVLEPPLNPFAVHVPMGMVQKLKRDIVHNFKAHESSMPILGKEDEIGGTPFNFLSSGEELEEDSSSESDETTAQDIPPMSPSDIDISSAQKKSSNYIDAAESLFTMLDEMESLRQDNKDLKRLVESLQKKNQDLSVKNESLMLAQTCESAKKLEFLERQNQALQKAMATKHHENEKFRKSIKVKENELNQMGLQITNVRLKHKGDVEKLHNLRQKVSFLLLAETPGMQNQDELLASQTLLQEENGRLNEHLRMLKDNKISADDQIFRRISMAVADNSGKDFESEENRFLAEREHFFLTCVSCQINLHDQLESDELELALDMSNSVLTENPEEIWKFARRDQVPMNQFHNYISDFLTARMEANRQSREIQTLEEVAAKMTECTIS